MISVVMTTYNGIKYIGEQVESILMQLSPDDQLIIGDNGSTDGTIEYLQSLRRLNPRIILSVYTDKLGVIANLNHALPLARGDLIFLTDQDDVWLAGRVDYCSKKFANDQALTLLQTNSIIIDENGTKTSEDFFSIRKCSTGILKNFWKNTWQGCNMVFKSSLLQVAYPIPEKVPMHDVWLGIVAELSGKVLMDNIILGLYRRHCDNQSVMSPSPIVQVVKWRLHLVVAMVRNYPRTRKYKKNIDK